MARLSADENNNVVDNPTTPTTDYGNRGQTDVFVPTANSFYAAPSGPGLPNSGLTTAAALPVLQPDTTGSANDRSNPPTAPAGYQYIWIGGSTSGQWQLYSLPSGSGTTTGGTTSTTQQPPVTGTTTTKSVVSVKDNGDGTTTLIWSDGSTTTQGVKDVSKTTSGQNALQLLTATLSGYGVDTTGAVSNAILGLIQKNYDAATIQALIEDPASAKSSDPAIAALANAWNTRFSGNVAREKAGLTPLSPADYISTENSYKAVMARAGISASSPLMDPSYFGQLMANDLSPAEVQQRVTAATEAVTTTDPFTLQQLQQNFGLTQEDMVHHLLDPNTAASVIQQKVQASQIQGEAGRQNLALNQQNAMTLAAQGVTQAQAAAGFTNIGTQLGAQQQLASMYGMQPNQVGNELTAQQFNSNINGVSAAKANIDLARLRAQEVNQFSGSSGASKGSLYTESQGVS